ncbi:EAL domain-containing protein [Anaerotignum lactatifermentans]|uniref:EAL domain-containing protein n=1 Tax=Anaerotignum lactatifermentans TaxID=160404 RepID=A0ABS2G8M1_9FIRM|nr:EAL domain-containing protein [Anaerotignum lactatifermentans]MBM6829458.1 EAL domain-containing protein [Anaerotignum lactatifermentans]MBM6877816.1 EAL domain-containing protein [Anaerotignum lactatifermentans]MBM6951035.1 EAL domain-containing protein [Anaerotignum lactatifermentans]
MTVQFHGFEISGRLRKKRRYISACIFAVLIALLFPFGFTSYAATETQVVKVGFPIQAGNSYIDENGNYCGYLVDYLNQLDMFTHWDIQFVQVDGDLDTQLSTLMYMLMDGEIDIMGTMNRNIQLEGLFLYPNYSYGTTYTTLAVLDDDLRWIEEDYSHWDNIRVATYPGYEGRTQEFEYFAHANNFSYTLVECASYDDMVSAVMNGRADALIQVDISLEDNFRIIGRFSPTPYYFALTKGNTALLQQLDTAMRSLNNSQPNLQMELYNLHFRHKGSFQISQEHRDYIRSLGTLKVLFFDGNAPYQYVKDGQLEGFAVEYWKNFADQTGLQYETVIADTYQDAFTLVENGEVDLVAGAATNSTLSSLDNIHFSLPYYNSFSVTACSNQKPHEHSKDLPFMTNTEAALNEIRHTHDYAAQLDYYSLSFYLRKKDVYDGVIVDWSNIKNFSYAFGITNNIPGNFESILNQYISSVSEETMQTMLYRYSGETVEYTPGEWIIANRVLIICTFAVFITLMGAMGILLRNRRLKYQNLLAENRLLQLSMYDAMTGAYNEPQFLKLFNVCCGNREDLVLVALNIHGFKYINGTYGTKRADEVLCAVKDILESETRDGEFFCRPSADLFYLALREKNVDLLLSRTNQIFSKIIKAGTAILEGHPLSLYSGAVFVGSSPSPYNCSANINYMMTALAQAKQVNSSEVYIFNQPLHQTVQLRYYIETHMHSALEQKEYLLYLQPKMNLQTGQIDGAEALVRWKPADREMIYPGQFISFFEEKGFCAQLDLYMIDKVCETLRSWIDAGIPPIAISVNQTRSLFMREDYVDRLLEITNRHRISPQYIVLEILEGLVFKNIDAVNKTIQKLNQAGFHVSMDDFGCGYSSLNTLGKLDLDELKLDRTFLMDVVNDPAGPQAEVMASVFTLAKKLGIKTVAEGVETKACEDIIRTMPCDYGQGYFYGKPMPAEDFLQKFFASMKKE